MSAPSKACGCHTASTCWREAWRLQDGHSLAYEVVGRHTVQGEQGRLLPMLAARARACRSGPARPTPELLHYGVEAGPLRGVALPAGLHQLEVLRPPREGPRRQLLGRWDAQAAAGGVRLHLGDDLQRGRGAGTLAVGLRNWTLSSCW